MLKDMPAKATGCGVTIMFASGRVGGLIVQLRQLQCQRICPGCVAAAMLDEHGMVGDGSVEILQGEPASAVCECASMKPGRTVLPPRSIFFAFPAASARTSSFDPIARKRLLEIATACALGWRGFTVQKLPLWRISSGSERSMPNSIDPLIAPRP